jgi:heme oxygenase
MEQHPDLDTLEPRADPTVDDDSFIDFLMEQTFPASDAPPYFSCRRCPTPIAAPEDPE